MAALRVEGIDRAGLGAKMTSAIADDGVKHTRRRDPRGGLPAAM
jgi:hypothetical protein